MLEDTERNMGEVEGCLHEKKKSKPFQDDITEHIWSSSMPWADVS